MSTKTKIRGFVTAVIATVLVASSAWAGIEIKTAADASASQQLGAKEIARYLYLQTGTLPEKSTLDGWIILATKEAKLLTDAAVRSAAANLQPQQYVIKTTLAEGKKTWWIVGGDDVGALYGAYRFLEHLGLRFYLHQDVVPETKLAALPDVDDIGKPLFERRGFSPWGAHPEGIDAWNADEWKSVLAQMTKMRMNTMSIHAYPWEPWLWVGKPEEVEADGRVRNAPPVHLFNTAKGTLWGVKPSTTSTYRFGASQMFEADVWGPEVMAGHYPVAKELADCVEVFNQTGEMLRDAFSFAHRLGMKVGVGGELGQVGKLALNSVGAAPIGADTDLNALPPNEALESRYEGIFTRLSRVHPLDFFTLYTQEGDYWPDGPKFNRVLFNKRMAEWKSALAVWNRMKPPFELVAGGWTLGPYFDRAAFDSTLPKQVTLSEFNRAYNGPVEPAFAGIQGREKWAGPWCEEDTPFLAPQLWVGRMRKDAADALAYQCTGIQGIFWRRSHVEPVADALARACWDQKGWNPQAGKTGPEAPPSSFYIEGPVSVPNNRWLHGYDPDATPKSDIGKKAIAGTEAPDIYQTCRYDLRGYRVKIPNGSYRVTLKFCEVYFDKKGQRVFDVALQKKTVLEHLDIFDRCGAMAACDINFDGIAVTNEWLLIDFIAHVSLPCLSAIEIKEGEGIVARVNCGGPDYKDWRGDALTTTQRAMFAGKGEIFEPYGLTSSDYYADWAEANFGLAQIGKVFADMDGRMPLFCSGNFSVVPQDERQWTEVEREYHFVEELERYRSSIKGAGNRERFERWRNTFQYARAMARSRCLLAEIGKSIGRVDAIKAVAEKKRHVRGETMPLLVALNQNTAAACTFLLNSVVDLGGMQTVIDLEARTGLFGLDGAVARVEKLLGEKLPEDCYPSMSYQGKSRIIVPTVRSILERNEPLRVQVIIMAQQAVEKATLHWRPLGGGDYQTVPLRHLARGVYTVMLPGGQSDFEYHIQAETAGGKSLLWPATAPDRNQTVVVW